LSANREQNEYGKALRLEIIQRLNEENIGKDKLKRKK